MHLEVTRELDGRTHVAGVVVALHGEQGVKQPHVLELLVVVCVWGCVDEWVCVCVEPTRL